jgi:DNA invertase Pin-like site-specific DNA recombinase
VDKSPGIPCVIYAAKSTEDRRGSIPEQLRECREAIEADPRRCLIAEYSDEAFSAYRRDRGPGLRDAIQHAEDLAVEHGIAELWAQHSDRIARGDGRKARHTVEIALWALKHDVRVRTLQDPETFRDLLYAVVTGQRNNEDSKRKAISSQAGRKRAVARGEYIGHLPDGYKLDREIDDAGQLCKRMVIDPDRQALFELLFRLALRGRMCGQVARTLNERGWLTKPVKGVDRPRPFDVGKVYELLHNPRYAALSVYRGEILARGHWPAYISERQHERLCRQLAHPREGHSKGPLDTYLLARLACCGRCGHRLRIATGRVRDDGTRARKYVCSSHRQYRGSAQCRAAPFDAHIAEAMVVASLPTLLGEEASDTTLPVLVPATTDVCAGSIEPCSPINGNDASSSDEDPVSDPHPYGVLALQTTRTQRRARELADVLRLRQWIDREADGRSEATRAEAEELNRLLRGWFSAIAIDVTPKAVEITATRRSASFPSSTTVTIDRADWTRLAPPGHRQLAPASAWSEAEMIGALQAWADRHARSPRRVEWERAGSAHPGSLTVCKHFGNWNRALRKAGLPPVARPARHPWTDEEIVEALRAWAKQHGRAPAHLDWALGARERPCAQTVWCRFGSWTRALHAAGLTPPPRKKCEPRGWTREEIIHAMCEWGDEHGRPPKGLEWARAGTVHPSAPSVRKSFGSWQAALQAAGLAHE